MTRCVKGPYSHDFPIEDDEGAYCAEHGVTLLWHGPPITPEDTAPETPARRAPLPPEPRALGQHPY
ncbi:hypothetical protein [Streptomyces sp. H27-C3]|uniref:hypothetical protein n=1 Tax=Streptomyces sp. H27-C3 TaxID=3046305 RepID=UPI0024BB00CE|nr:hypothetical protein [Streptomyces sp. H27-C3]MDJ0460567.1 hypothetical protein [Streptomyces sp. H27-C3]